MCREYSFYLTFCAFDPPAFVKMMIRLGDSQCEYNKASRDIFKVCIHQN